MKLFSFLLKKQSKHAASKGFSLVELLVVIAIFTIITSVVLINQTRFSSDILITNLAYEIALQIRQAQVYGIGVKEEGGQFNYAYGVHIDDTNISASSKFTLFIDSDGTHSYNPSGIEKIEEFLPVKGNRIVDFCTGTFDDLSCIVSGNNPIGALDITFLRPNPEAIIYSTKHGDIARSDPGPAHIILQSSLGDKCKRVDVERTGQISVPTETVPCQYPYH